jgi:hypothetical protein
MHLVRERILSIYSQRFCPTRDYPVKDSGKRIIRMIGTDILAVRLRYLYAFWIDQRSVRPLAKGEEY